MRDELVIKDIPKFMELIKSQNHRNDKFKIAVGGAATGGAVGAAAGVASTTVATLGPVTIGGSIGTWLVSHGILGAATIFSVPGFLVIALPAVGGYIVYNLVKNNQTNKLLREYTTTADIDLLGKKVAEGFFLPVIYFLRTMNIGLNEICDELMKKMRIYGFCEVYARKFLSLNSEITIENLKSKIINQDVNVVLSVQNGKKKLSKELKLSFLHEKSIKLCKELLSNNACFNFSDESFKRGEKIIEYIRKELFKKNRKF